MKEYPEYKETGLYWYEKIPCNWKLQKAKYLFNKESRPLKPEYETVTCFRDGEVTLRKKRRTTGFTESLQENGYQGVMPGDLVIHVMDAFAGATGVSDSEGKCTPVYNICTAKIAGINNYFYAYFLRFMAWSGYIVSLSKGIRERSTEFRFDVFGNQFLPIPPISEQNTIVRYLDYKTKQIDEFVSAKEKEITLLEEFKRSLISDYVSKGNSQTEMKESGIEWIHKIPKHWKTLMLFQCAEEYFKSNKDIHHQNLLSLSYGKIKRKDINTKGGLLPESFDNYQVVKKGNIILRLTDLQNDHRSLRTGLVTETGIITSAYVCIKPRENVTPEYLHWILRCCDLHKVFYGMGGGVRQSIGYTDISKMYFPIPPLEEQNVIADYLDKKTSEIDTLITSIQKQIALVKELRTKIIADAVTGKIDVREAI